VLLSAAAVGVVLVLGIQFVMLFVSVPRPVSLWTDRSAEYRPGNYLRSAAVSGIEVPAALQGERLVLGVTSSDGHSCSLVLQASLRGKRLPLEPVLDDLAPDDAGPALPAHWRLEVPTAGLGQHRVQVRARSARPCRLRPARLRVPYVVLPSAVVGARLQVIGVTGSGRGAVTQLRLTGEVHEGGYYRLRLGFSYRPQHLLPWIRELQLARGPLRLDLDVPAEEVGSRLGKGIPHPGLLSLAEAQLTPLGPRRDEPDEQRTQMLYTAFPPPVP